LDTPGPCARTVEDAALLHAVIAGHDPRDSTSIPAPVPDVVGAARLGATGDLSGVRLGVVREFAGEGAEPGVVAAVREGIEALVKLGAEGGRGVLPELRVRAAGVLPDRAERVLLEPGPVRRRPVRPAGRRRRAALPRGGHVDHARRPASGPRSSGAS
jgi:Asp-tRNA(Asn)/Glu-tRNA(Gln) amidotransferase A subunit family amidase